MDAFKKIEKYGNLPANLGWDPYKAWRYQCRDCGHTGYIFENMLTNRERKAGFRKGDRWKACKSCRGTGNRVCEVLCRKRAFHLNDIRHRKSTVSSADAENGY